MALKKADRVAGNDAKKETIEMVAISSVVG
jgi:hypothetical protein